ncbi:hypothetical protein Aab01nite_68710 [Paractinoplanes abujensis]|uniref:Fibronectin type-III domain-containing protein n=1 Tax=Paractinoplanes abujensis TaxID=882441 RepID=A0A7W7G680_9ACTN|nr:hypothetical protein [Actinoplanes abujensis]MBB4695696.1 hypothetical protein [Actinoplanes abujensis]GID23281.1 hypothetical protein Aab01nite_68710 [Actinoplanes abujensis]
MRRGPVLVVMLPFLLSACGSGSTPSGSASPTAADGPAWVNVEPGRPTSSAVSKYTGTPRPGLPPVSFLPTSSACAVAWNEDVGRVFIPMIVTVGRGSLTVQWPNRFGNRYRVAAVPQELVSGAQPEPQWQTVTTGAECTAGTTISGLKSGAAYVVWLDAPDTPRGLDGSRGLYSGRSQIVQPN